MNQLRAITNKAIQPHSPSKQQLVTSPTGITTNKMCQLVEQLANTTLGSANGLLAGDVIGTLTLGKLNELATGAIMPGSNLWPLATGAAIPKLAQPCEPLRKPFLEYHPSQEAATTAIVPAMPVTATDIGSPRRLLALPQ